MRKWTSILRIVFFNINFVDQINYDLSWIISHYKHTYNPPKNI